MTLTEKYRSLLEGKYDKAQFIKDALFQFPQYITPTNSLQDVITILKNKSVISENSDIKASKPKSSDETSTQVSGFKGYIDLKPIMFMEGKKPTNKLKGGKGDNLTPDRVNPYELKKGMEVEKEHTDEADKALEIVLDHLAENPSYYTDLVAFESGKKRKNRSDLPIELNKKGDNVVDKANGTKPVSKEKVTSNVRDVKDKPKKIKVKEMTMTPVKVKGVKKVMDVPGKKGKTIKLKENNGDGIHSANGTIVDSRIKATLQKLIHECMCELGLKEDSYDNLVHVKYSPNDGKLLLQKIEKDLGADSDIYKKVKLTIDSNKTPGNTLMTNRGMALVANLLHDNDMDEYFIYLDVPVNELKKKIAENSPAPTSTPPANRPIISKSIKEAEDVIKFCIAAQNKIKKAWLGGKEGFGGVEKIKQIQQDITDLFNGLNLNKNRWIASDYLTRFDKYIDSISASGITASKVEDLSLYTAFDISKLRELMSSSEIPGDDLEKLFGKYSLEEDVNLDKSAKEAEKRATDAKIRALQAKKNELSKI